MREWAQSILMLAGTCAVSACVSARLHSVDEINTVGRECGVALGELFQDESEKKLLFLMRPGATGEQRACIAKWARQNHLKTVFVEAINFPEEG